MHIVMDTVFVINEDVKPVVTNVTLLSGVLDSTCDVWHQTKIKEEFSQTELEIHVKEEMIQTWELPSEASNLRHDAKPDNDWFIKLESIHEEVDIKTEILSSNEDNVIVKPDKHTKIHTNKEYFGCTVCNYACIKRCTLNRHMRIHTVAKPFKYSKCDFESTSKISSHRHKTRHEREKPYKCNICGYESAQKNILLSHMSTHTGKKPFKCNLCDYETAWKICLHQHLSSHTVEKPFKCTMCDFESAHKINLQRHVRTHTREKKPFRCSVCDYKSAHKITLLYHIVTHRKYETMSLKFRREGNH